MWDFSLQWAGSSLKHSSSARGNQLSLASAITLAHAFSHAFPPPGP